MKICEITDIIHDEDEHESTVETYLFLNKNEALEKFKELCEDRIDHILESKRDNFEDEDEFDEFASEVREGFDMNVPSFNFFDFDNYSYTTIRLDDKEVG